MAVPRSSDQNNSKGAYCCDQEADNQHSQGEDQLYEEHNNRPIVFGLTLTCTHLHFTE